MERKAFLIGFLALTLLLAQMAIISTSVAASSQESVVRLDAKGGVPGKPEPPPDEPPVPPEEPQAYELFIEIDYMPGHEPTQAVLDYIRWYYMGNNPSGDLIDVTFYADYYDSEGTLVDSMFSDAVSLDESVSSADFWAIESQYNNNDNGYYSKWKWVLYGTTVDGEPNTFGYTSGMSTRKDLVAGNYIYIADGTADNWATTPELEIGAEAVVLMHEMGHSIGIAKIHPAFGEQYDPDSSSVMSYISTANAGQFETWYYSDSYWATSNMEYYAVAP